jgi:hypothetical protein
MHLSKGGIEEWRKRLRQLYDDEVKKKKKRESFRHQSRQQKCNKSHLMSLLALLFARRMEGFSSCVLIVYKESRFLSCLSLVFPACALERFEIRERRDDYLSDII